MLINLSNFLSQDTRIPLHKYVTKLHVNKICLLQGRKINNISATW